MPGAALDLFVEVAREWKAAGKLKDRSAWAGECRERKRTMLRRTHFDNVPIKPQRVYQEMNQAFDADTCYVTTIGLSQIAGAQFLHVYKPRRWINAARPARSAGRCRRHSACGRPTPTADRGALRRL